VGTEQTGKETARDNGRGSVIEIIARGGTSPAKAAIARLVEAQGAWVALDGEHPLVRSPQTRRYWSHKVGLRLEIGRDTDTKRLFARLVAL
jgi:hypothetical protein